MADVEIVVRDGIGRCLFAAGSVIMRLGGWLCGLAGWWDAGTDARPTPWCVVCDCPAVDHRCPQRRDP